MQSLIFGIHAVKSALLNLHSTSDKPSAVLNIEAEKNSARICQLIDLATSVGVSTRFLKRHEMTKLCQDKHQGVVLRFDNAQQSLVSEMKNETFLEDLVFQKQQQLSLLILDGVQDPHNLGACLRTANAAGFDAVIIPKDRAVGLTPVVRKVACGADQYTPLIQVTNLARSLAFLKQAGVWITGLAGEAGQSLFETQFNGNVALVSGAEGKGLRRLTRDKCDQLVYIPMLGQVESMNVSVATGIALYEVLKQRL